MNFCPGFIPEEDSYAIMNRALGLGINDFYIARPRKIWSPSPLNRKRSASAM
jgi:hypothetical protein